MLFCDSIGCPQSSPYWTLMVEDGNRQYEFHQPFAMGSSRAPEYVEVGGVMIRSGVEVAVVGAIEPITPTYGIISEVKNVSVLSNHSLTAEAYVDSIWGAEGTGWNCANAENIGYSVGAWIWYGRRSVSENETFHLRVMAKRVSTGINQQGVAEIGNVQMKQLSSSLVYEGAIDATAAALAISRSSPQIRNYPSTLRISTAQSMNGAPFPIAGAVRMICNPSQAAFF